MFEGVAIKGDAPLRIESIEPLGFDLPMVDITTETGDFIADGVISHNCFARPTHTYLDMNAGSDFEKKIVVKVNAPEVLRRQLAAKRWKGEGIAMGTPTETLGTSAKGSGYPRADVGGSLARMVGPRGFGGRGRYCLGDSRLEASRGGVGEAPTATPTKIAGATRLQMGRPGSVGCHPRRAGAPVGLSVSVLHGLSR
jgi:hypothetical protein